MRKGMGTTYPHWVAHTHTHTGDARIDMGITPTPVPGPAGTGEFAAVLYRLNRSVCLLAAAPGDTRAFLGAPADALYPLSASQENTL